MWTLIIVLAVFGIFMAFGVVENRANEKALEKIPLRINVNGIRGKSTATRLITAILNEAGYHAVGKTTGTEARMMYWYSDKEEKVIRKPRGVNISEQLQVIRKAAEKGADALVCECMAVRPEYQRTYQEQIIKAPVTVITNVIEDHLEDMGPTMDQIASAFAGTIPYNGIVIIPECEYTRYFKDMAFKRGSSVRVIHDKEVPEDYLDKFDYKLFSHNVATGLAVARALGIDKETALRGMLKANPDPGALRTKHVGASNTGSTVVNAFAANDPGSTLEIWENVKKEEPTLARNPVVVMNCRPDRVDRTKQFAEDCLPYIDNAILLAVGENTKDITAAYNAGKLANVSTYIDMDGVDMSKVFAKLTPYLHRRVVFCIGNIHGGGQELLDMIGEYGKRQVRRKNSVGSAEDTVGRKKKGRSNIS